MLKNISRVSDIFEEKFLISARPCNIHYIFIGVFNKRINLLVLVVYEMI